MRPAEGPAALPAPRRAGPAGPVAAAAGRVGPARAVERVLVVVPARDEAAALPACLAALHRAALRCPVPVRVVVVADRCTDATARVAAARGALVVTSAAGLVGAARAAGVAAGLAGSPGGARRTWVACTDADSQVPPGWLAHHVHHAGAGADLLLGTVRLAGPPDRHAAWRAAYAAGLGPGGRHRHVHGANLGVRASAYLAAGGFAPTGAHEDRLLAAAVRALPGARVVTSSSCPVLTSAREVGRAPHGVARDLRAAAGAAAGVAAGGAGAGCAGAVPCAAPGP
ncbi:glycosyltransferase [Kineococcus gypseus]|uniref:glycosyltransferase n=1 Tax=Kineococcus gypseus TaxID=1637102 RepID=UPI003D7D816F